MTPRRPAPARPGARPGARRTARTTPGPSPEPQTPPPDAAGPAGPDPAGREEISESAVVRLAGTDGLAVPTRAIILVLVLLLAFVVTFPSLRGYLSQRARYDAVVDEIARARETSSSLEEELALWQDDDYVKSQARERLAYVMPGETTYVVVGADRFRNDAASSATSADASEHRPWYEVVRESARVAGGAEQSSEPAADPAQRSRATTPPPASAPSGASAAPAPAPTGSSRTSGATP